MDVYHIKIRLQNFNIINSNYKEQQYFLYYVLECKF